MSDKVYARVVDGVIAEYPVFPIHIENRGHPVEWYTQVEYPAQPELPPFTWLKEDVAVNITLQGVVHVKASYTVIPFTLAEVLNQLRKPGEFPGMPGSEPMEIEDVPLPTVMHVADLATAYAQHRMDTFAQTKKYDNINSAASYKDSTLPSFHAEGSRAFLIRDQTYAALYTYLGQVQTKQLPVPTTVDEIEAILPVLSWE